MKCDRIAVYGWKSKNSMEKFPPIVLGSLSLQESGNERFIPKFFSHKEPCDGTIVGCVELEYIPYFGGGDTSVEIRFICKRCMYDFANENGLPYDIHSLNKFLTKVIQDL